MVVDTVRIVNVCPRYALMWVSSLETSNTGLIMSAEYVDVSSDSLGQLLSVPKYRESNVGGDGLTVETCDSECLKSMYNPNGWSPPFKKHCADARQLCDIRTMPREAKPTDRSVLASSSPSSWMAESS